MGLSGAVLQGLATYRTCHGRLMTHVLHSRNMPVVAGVLFGSHSHCQQKLCLSTGFMTSQSRRISIVEEVPKLDTCGSSKSSSTNKNMKVNTDFRVDFPKSEEVTDPFWPINSNLTGSNQTVEKAVVVVLLGWAGATQKNLSKYSDVYLKHGCITVRYIPPVQYGVFETSKLPVVAEALVLKLKELNLSDHPVFLHAFSNNGSLMHSHVLREFSIYKDEIPVNFKGSMFDSGPIRRVFGPFMRMLPTLMPSKLGPLRYPLAGLITLTLALCTTMWYIKYAVAMIFNGERIPESLSRSKSRKESIPLHNWLKRTVAIQNHPFLFLYSTKDYLVPPTAVESMAAVVKRNGNPVKLLNFGDSDHVQHFKLHPQEYIQGIRHFISSTMQENRGLPKYWDEVD